MKSVAGAVALLAAGTPAAWGAECEDLGEAEFRSLVLDAQAAIDRGNLVLPCEIIYEIELRIPCLTFAPAPRMWADLMVARAIVEYRAAPRARAWKDALYAALRIRPMVDRGVSSVHPIARWDPLDDPNWSPPSGAPLAIPLEREVYVDGMRDQEVPLGGLTLVQRTDGKWWNSVLVHADEELVSSWVSDDVEQPPRVRYWVRLGVTAGASALLQTPDWDSDVWQARSDAGGALGAIGDLQLTFFSPFGLLVQGGASVASLSPGHYGRLSGIWTAGGLTLGVGVGTAAVDTYEVGRVVGEVTAPATATPPTTTTTPPTTTTTTTTTTTGATPEVASQTVHQFSMLRHPVVTVMYRTPGAWSVDAGAAVGVGPSLSRLDLDLGLAPPPLGKQRFRLGLNVTGQNALFNPQGLPDRLLTSTSVRTLLRLDLVIGEDY